MAKQSRAKPSRTPRGPKGRNAGRGQKHEATKNTATEVNRPPSAPSENYQGSATHHGQTLETEIQAATNVLAEHGIEQKEDNNIGGRVGLMEHYLNTYEDKAPSETGKISVSTAAKRIKTRAEIQRESLVEQSVHPREAQFREFERRQEELKLKRAASRLAKRSSLADMMEKYDEVQEQRVDKEATAREREKVEKEKAERAARREELTHGRDGTKAEDTQQAALATQASARKTPSPLPEPEPVVPVPPAQAKRGSNAPRRRPQQTSKNAKGKPQRGSKVVEAQADNDKNEGLPEEDTEKKAQAPRGRRASISDLPPETMRNMKKGKKGGNSGKVTIRQQDLRRATMTQNKEASASAAEVAAPGSRGTSRKSSRKGSIEDGEEVVELGDEEFMQKCAEMFVWEPLDTEDSYDKNAVKEKKPIVVGGEEDPIDFPENFPEAGLQVHAMYRLSSEEKKRINDVLLLAGRLNRVTDISKALDKGADIDSGNEFGTTVLLQACQDGNLQLVNLVLEKGADPLKTDRGGGTALHYAARFGKEDIVKQLLQTSIDPRSEDYSGQTPVDLAKIGGFPVVQMLCQEAVDRINQEEEEERLRLEAEAEAERLAEEERMRLKEREEEEHRRMMAEMKRGGKGKPKSKKAASAPKVKRQ